MLCCSHYNTARGGLSRSSRKLSRKCGFFQTALPRAKRVEKGREEFSFFAKLGLTNLFFCVILSRRNTESRKNAGMAELADARDLKSRET